MGRYLSGAVAVAAVDVMAEMKLLPDTMPDQVTLDEIKYLKTGCVTTPANAPRLAAMGAYVEYLTAFPRQLDGGQRIVSVTYDTVAGVYYAIVGASGTNGTDIYKSTDGLRWTFVSTPGITMYRIAYGGGKLVVSGGTPRYSTDGGVTWEVGAMTNAGNMTGLAYVNNLWVCTGASGRIHTSDDGIAWTQRRGTVASNDLNAIAYGGGLYVAVGNYSPADPQILTSPDGITWTNRASGLTDIHLNGIAHNGTLFMIVGQSGKTLTSTDGSAWTAITTGASDCKGVVHCNGTFYIATYTASTIYISNDGTTVSSFTKNWLPQFYGLDIITAGGKVLFVGGNSPSAACHALRLDTPVAGNGAAAVDFAWLTAEGQAGLKCCCYDATAGKFFIGGTASNQIGGVTSDGVVFSNRSPHNGNNYSYNSAAYAAQLGGVVIVGDFGNGAAQSAALSVDGGTTWTASALGAAAGNAVACSDEKIVAVGVNGAIAYGTTGKAWTAITAGATTFNGVGWNGSFFTAVGNISGSNPVIYTSPDGVAWTARANASTAQLNAVAGNAAITVAVGNSGTIYTSSDGATWTARTANAGTQHLLSVVWTGSCFIAGGAGGTMIKSADGIAWTGVPSGTAADIKSIAYGNSHLIGVGPNGLGCIDNESTSYVGVIRPLTDAQVPNAVYYVRAS